MTPASSSRSTRRVTTCFSSLKLGCRRRAVRRRGRDDHRPSRCSRACAGRSAAARPAGPAPMMPTLSRRSWRGRNWRYPAFAPGQFGQVFLDGADSDCAMLALLDHARAFTEPVLRADAATYFRHRIGRGRRFVASCRRLQRRASANPGCCSAAGNVTAERHPALGAAGGLGGGVLNAELAVDFTEIAQPLVRRAARWPFPGPAGQSSASCRPLRRPSSRIQTVQPAQAFRACLRGQQAVAAKEWASLKMMQQAPTTQAPPCTAEARSG